MVVLGMFKICLFALADESLLKIISKPLGYGWQRISAIPGSKRGGKLPLLPLTINAESAHRTQSHPSNFWTHEID